MDPGHFQYVQWCCCESSIVHEPQSGVEGIQCWCIYARAVQDGFLGHDNRIGRWGEKLEVG